MSDYDVLFLYVHFVVNNRSATEGILQRANMERGTGSVGRQKDIINRGVQDDHGDMFAGGSKIIMSKLVDAAEVSLDESSEEIRG